MFSLISEVVDLRSAPEVVDPLKSGVTRRLEWRGGGSSQSDQNHFPLWRFKTEEEK